MNRLCFKGKTFFYSVIGHSRNLSYTKKKTIKGSCEATSEYETQYGGFFFFENEM